MTNRKYAYKFVKFVFKHEKDIRVAIAEALTKKGDGSGPPNHDPTGTAAIKRVPKVKAVILYNIGKRHKAVTIHNPELWLYVVNWTYKSSGAFERNIAELYYRRHRTVTSIHTEYNFKTGSIVYNILNEFQQMAVEAACQLGLIEVLPREQNYENFGAKIVL